MNVSDESVLNRLKDVLDNYEHCELSENHKRTLNERLEAHKNNPEAGSGWEEVKQRFNKLN